MCCRPYCPRAPTTPPGSRAHREQAVVDLQRALPAVAAVAELGQRTAAAFEVARRQVIERQGACVQLARGEPLLGRALARKQPVHRCVQVILVGVGDTEVLGQCRGLPPARGRELGVRGDVAMRSSRAPGRARARAWRRSSPPSSGAAWLVQRLAHGNASAMRCSPSTAPAARLRPVGLLEWLQSTRSTNLTDWPACACRPWSLRDMTRAAARWVANLGSAQRGYACLLVICSDHSSTKTCLHSASRKNTYLIESRGIIGSNAALRRWNLGLVRNALEIGEHT